MCFIPNRRRICYCEEVCPCCKGKGYVTRPHYTVYPWEVLPWNPYKPTPYWCNQPKSQAISDYS